MATSNASDTDYQTLFQAAVDSQEVGHVARETAQHVVAKLLEVEKSTEGAELTTKIQAAATSGDIALIFKLTDELKDLKSGEDQRSAKLAKLADEFTFNELLNAFPADYKALVYSIGLETIKRADEVKKKHRAGHSKPRSRGQLQNVTYVITNATGETIEAHKNVGAPKSPGAERSFFEFMGFAVSEDGRSIEPPTFKNIKAEKVNSASKKHVIEDLLAGHEYWVEKGYLIKAKE